jgi:hypothetical protein
MKALFLSMQIESSKLDPLRFNGSAADRVSVIAKLANAGGDAP